MNSLAEQLNKDLSTCILDRVMSDLGRRMYFPKGIVAQAAEAKQKAHRFNATVGMAYAGGVPMTLPVIDELTGELSTSESVAYAPTAGIPALRERWAELMLEKNPSLRGSATTKPAVVPGLTAGLSIVGDLLVEPGDTLLVPDLFWGNYRLMFGERRQAHLQEFPFFDQNGVFAREAFRTAAQGSLGSGKLLLLLNFPNNPAGFTPTQGDADFIVETLVGIAEQQPVVVLCDDAYFGLFYSKDVLTESLFARLAGAHKNLLAVKVDGATKEDYVWGFRVGFITVAFKGMTSEHEAAIERKLMGAIRSMVSNSSRLSQSILLRALNDSAYGAQKQAAYDLLHGRFKKLQAILDEQRAQNRAPNLIPLPCNSGYFMSYRCVGISAEELRAALLERGVGAIAVGETYLRIAFAGIDAADLPALYEEVFAAAESLA